MKFYPYKKKRGGEVLAMLKGGGTNSFGVVFGLELEVLAILKGGAKGFHSLKGGARKVLACLEGGGAAQKVSDSQFSHFTAPTSP